jgi:hypothetical protein
MLAKWRKTIVGADKEGRSKFWVCKSCKIKFKIGAQVISKRSMGVLSDEEIRNNLNLPPKPAVASGKQVFINKHKHKKEKAPEQDWRAEELPEKPALLTTPFNTVSPNKEKE